MARKLEDICSEIVGIQVADTSVTGNLADWRGAAYQKEIILAEDTARAEIKRDADAKKEQRLKDLRLEAVEAAKKQMQK